MMMVISDGQVKKSQQWLEELLRLFGTPTSVRLSEQVDCYWLTIDDSKLTREQVETLIGTDGNVIDAIQSLANTILNLGEDYEQQIAYTVEISGYRLRRLEQLRSLAEYAANQVRLTGREFELQHLSSSERRQVHTILKEADDLETYSRGQEPDRRLVIRFKGY